MKNKVCAWLLIILGIFMLLGVTAVVGVIVLIAGAGASQEPAIVENSYLLFKASDVIPDHSVAPRFAAIDEGGPTVTSIVTALAHAKNDSRIKGVILECAGVWGFAGVREAREALRDFKVSGKPVYAYLETGSDRDYYLASIADTVVMYPGRSGGLYHLGVGITSTYLKNTLEKLGVRFHVLHVGDYKGAFENLSHDSMSGPLRESLQLVLDGLYETYVSEIVADRPGLTRARMDQDILSGSRFSLYGDSALAAGYADLAMDWTEFRDRLAGGPDEKLKTVQIAEYAHAVARSDAAKTKEIAVLCAQGEIKYSAGPTRFVPSSDEILPDDMTKMLNDLADDEDVAAIVLRVNSPGGSALASELILREVLRAKAKKPVVVSMSSVAASGGYYISCGANHIVAHPNTITGSIGVVGAFPTAKELYDKVGARVEVVEKGKWINFPRFDQDLDPADERILLNSMKDIYDEFVGRVVEGRGLTREQVHEIAQGRVWTGTQALERKLIDEVGDLSVAIDRAAELAEVDRDEVKVRYYPKEDDLVTYLLKRFRNLPMSVRQAALPTDETGMLMEALEYLKSYYSSREYMQFLSPVAADQ